VGEKKKEKSMFEPFAKRNCNYDSFGPDVYSKTSLDIVCIIKKLSVLCPVQHLAHILPVIDEVREGPSVDLHMLARQFGHGSSKEFLHSGQFLHKSTKKKEKKML
jgi:hypothetical protein